MNENFCAEITGTGAAIDVKCGFVPAKVEIYNITSTTKETLEWVRGMPAASGIKTVAGTVARTFITSNGISPLNATDGSTGEQGFRIGADADINVSAEKLLVIAYRGGEGNQF
jgi:hypothetical protein